MLTRLLLLVSSSLDYFSISGIYDNCPFSYSFKIVNKIVITLPIVSFSLLILEIVLLISCTFNMFISSFLSRCLLQSDSSLMDLSVLLNSFFFHIGEMVAKCIMIYKCQILLIIITQSRNNITYAFKRVGLKLKHD